MAAGGDGIDLDPFEEELHDVLSQPRIESMQSMPKDFFETWLLQWQGNLYDTLAHSLVKF